MWAIVTGANTGIGKEICRGLWRRGYNVVLACRSVRRGADAVTAILEDGDKDVPDALGGASVVPRERRGRLEVGELDLSSLASVDTFVRSYCATHDVLHVLVNNAGIGGLPSVEPRVTRDGLESVFQTNYHGHFALTLGLLDLLLRSEPSRVVNLSSALHWHAQRTWSAAATRTRGDSYAVSKLAMLCFALELQRRVAGRGDCRAFAVSPGAVGSDIWRVLPGWVQCVIRATFLTPAQGAATAIFAATEPSLEGGQYIIPYYQPCCGRVFEYYGPFAGPRVARPSAAALNLANCRDLWVVSEDLLAASRVAGGAAASETPVASTAT